MKQYDEIKNCELVRTIISLPKTPKNKGLMIILNSDNLEFTKNQILKRFEPIEKLHKNEKSSSNLVKYSPDLKKIHRIWNKFADFEKKFIHFEKKFSNLNKKVHQI